MLCWLWLTVMVKCLEVLGFKKIQYPHLTRLTLSVVIPILLCYPHVHANDIFSQYFVLFLQFSCYAHVCANNLFFSLFSIMCPRIKTHNQMNIPNTAWTKILVNTMQTLLVMVVSPERHGSLRLTFELFSSKFLVDTFFIFNDWTNNLQFNMPNFFLIFFLFSLDNIPILLNSAADDGII